MAGNCWKDCSPLETGLGLALIVSVTFLIIMIIVYLALGYEGFTNVFVTSMYQCSKACFCINKFSMNLFFPIGKGAEKEGLPKDGKKDVEPEPSLLNEQLYLKWSESKLQETICSSQNYPIAAVLQRSYIDSLDSFKYLCPAAILSPRWLISQSTFPYNVTNIHAAIGSKYWSKDGYLHHVDKIVTVIDVLFLLKLEVDLIIKIDFIGLMVAPQKRFVSVTMWNEKMKYEESNERSLYIAESQFCNNKSFCAGPFIDGLNLKYSLAISDNSLCGFYNDILCFEKSCLYQFFSMEPYILYIKHILDIL